MRENWNIPIFCISLARATKRREAMRRRLDSLALPYQMIDAVDGKELDLTKLKNRLRQDIMRSHYGRSMNNAEIGCYLSHYNLWQKVVYDRHKYALILEDDVVWTCDFISVIECLQNIPYPYDIIVLHTAAKKYGGDDIWNIGDIGYKIMRGKMRIAGTAGYLISMDGAKKLLQYCWEINAPIDNAYSEYWLNECRYYAIEPKIIHEIENESTIGVSKKTNGGLMTRMRASVWRKLDRRRCKSYNREFPLSAILKKSEAK